MTANAVICSLFVAVLLSTVVCSCPVKNPEDCVTQQQTNLPSPADIEDYCVSAPVAVVNAKSCLDSCNAASNSFTYFKQLVDNTCSVTPGCSNLTEMVTSYYECYDNYGGLHTIISAIIYGFNNRNTTSTNDNCNLLMWGRRCQRNYLTTCTYFPIIDFNYFLDNPLLDNSLYICGSETVPLITQTDTCTDAMATAVETKCNVACDLEAAMDAVGYCETLQWQADCILNITAGCTTLQKQYLVPRLDSYAFANIVLGCQIQTQTIIVQPRDPIGCTYQAQLLACFNINTPISAYTLTMVQELLNVDAPINSYCSMMTNSVKYLQSCSYSMLFCSLPQAKVYGPSMKFDGSYQVSMGPFPLNTWGLNTTFTWLNNQCPSSDTLIFENLCTRPSTPPILPTETTPAPKRVTPTVKNGLN